MTELDRKRVVIDFNIDDQWPDIRGFLDRASTIISLENTEPWELDCRQCGYLGPNDLP
ncbi:hypothetical protein MNBD_PLANCTO03-1421 [hydrothermal vent metagenome]|uniref:Uncharacterized protein n=1 Tax=hydrothermal vent metagenome TaxID=652676 RepID=A0A3B1DDG2_9ZZZZ